MLIHASCVALDGQGVLLMGPPGIGKSEMALRLIEDGAVLVSDDQTVIEIKDHVPCASPPPTIEGLIEVRHVGLLRGMPFAKGVPVRLVVILVADANNLARLPEPEVYSLLDQPVRQLKLPAWEAATPIKIRKALVGTFLDG